VLTGAMLSSVIGVIAYWRGSLSLSGAVAASLVGALIYWANPTWFIVLMSFFVTSTLLGRVGRAKKELTKREFSKGDRRDAWQVLANGGIGALAAAGSLIHPSPIWQPLFVGAIATANGDTWATELGVLSSREPFSLVKWRRVPRGTSGAISPLGLFATIGGAALMGMPFLEGRLLLVAALAGTAGSLTDSLLGATLQTHFHCPQCNRETEGARHHCGAECKKLGGFLDNDAVNLLATLAGALIAMLVS
jgi:uncharacterized protein (TIGR00297 family)